MTLTTSFFLFKLVSQVCWEEPSANFTRKDSLPPYTLGLRDSQRLDPGPPPSFRAGLPRAEEQGVFREGVCAEMTQPCICKCTLTCIQRASDSSLRLKVRTLPEGSLDTFPRVHPLRLGPSWSCPEMKWGESVPLYFPLILSQFYSLKRFFFKFIF